MGLNDVMAKVKADNARPRVGTAKAAVPQRERVCMVEEHGGQFKPATVTEIKAVRLSWKAQGKLVCRKCANVEGCDSKQWCIAHDHCFYRATGVRFIKTLQAVRAARQLFMEEQRYEEGTRDAE